METLFEVQTCNYCESTNVKYHKQLDKFICDTCGQHMTEGQTASKHLPLSAMRSFVNSFLVLLLVCCLAVPAKSQINLDSLVLVNIHKLNLDSIVKANTPVINIDSIVQARTPKINLDSLIAANVRRDTIKIPSLFEAALKTTFPYLTKARNYYYASGTLLDTSAGAVNFYKQAGFLDSQVYRQQGIKTIPLATADVIELPDYTKVNVSNSNTGVLSGFINDGGALYRFATDNGNLKAKTGQTTAPNAVSGITISVDAPGQGIEIKAANVVNIGSAKPVTKKKKYK